MSDINSFFELFSDGDLEVEKYFGDYEVWFNILKKRGLISKVDPVHLGGSEEWQNNFLLWALDNDRPTFNYWIPKLLDDVIFENGNFYLNLRDRTNLASLFCNNYRNDLSSDTIEKILSDDGDFFEPYWDTTDDVYRDVIEELNKENIVRLKNYIVKTLKGDQLSPETDEMELIAAEQGHNDYWEITEDNVSRILNDKESMESLMEDELSDMKSELYSIHSSSYNSAYEEEVYKAIFDELEEYFSDGAWVTGPHPFKDNTLINYFKMNIFDLEGQLRDFLTENKGYGGRHTLEYFGSFLGVLKETKDCIHAHAPDYPDPGKVDDNINSYFKDFF